MQTHNYTSKCFYEHTHATSTYISLLRSSGMKCIVKPCTNTYARSTHNSVRSKWSICDANVRNKDDVKITMLRTPKWIERCSMNGISIETNTHLSACRWDFYVPLKKCCSCMCVHVYVGLIAHSLCSSFSLAPPRWARQSVSHSVCSLLCTNRINSPANHHRCFFLFVRCYSCDIVCLSFSISVIVWCCTCIYIYYVRIQT